VPDGPPLFGEIARHTDGTAVECPAGDEGPQQALRGGQRGQSRDALRFILELGGQVRVEHEGAQPRRIELQCELTIMGADFVGGPLVERQLLTLFGRGRMRRPRQGDECARTNERIRRGLARFPKVAGRC
jgi:hypothetical protein